MNKFLLATTAILPLMTGVALAQTASSTTETTTVTPAPVVPPTVVETTQQRTVGPDGVTEHSRSVTTGTDVSPYGDTTTTRRTTETTTTR